MPPKKKIPSPQRPRAQYSYVQEVWSLIAMTIVLLIAASMYLALFHVELNEAKSITVATMLAILGVMIGYFARSRKKFIDKL
ncbi:hypothetical protein Brsp07_04622 [Brucella sp. NBRC 14130]|uniref:hypothetical protein n=1 Tax=Brucella sp. NBRC 14130 TaxID=3075483 RepID=UPI00309DAE06